MTLALVLIPGIIIISGLIAWRVEKKHPGKKSWLAWPSLILSLLGLWLVFYGSSEVQSGFARRQWTQIEGVIVQSRVEGTRAFHPNIIYEYEVDSVTYRDSTDLHQPAFGGRARRREVAVTGLAEYPPGDRIPVWYNPERPAEAVIILRVDWSYYAMIGLGLVLSAGLATWPFLPVWPGKRK